jgi:hypothetical protein
MQLARLSDQTKRAAAAARRRLKQRLKRAPAATSGSNASSLALGDEALWPLRELYEGSYEVEPVSFGTVRDYADSVDNFGGLARASADMKNLQRCWMVKAILGTVPAGSRLLEIGAGEPLAAGLLSRLGYDVTVVDPYDGSGNGPREFSVFTEAYPDLTVIRDQFPPAARPPAGFGAIYSISVLEHVPLEQIEGVVEAAERLLAPDGVSIHAVDHVLAGFGAESHREGLERIVACSGLDRAALAATIERMERDPETYFVSAEAHNQWRGAIEYEAYPMRRIGSVHLCKRLSG